MTAKEAYAAIKTNTMWAAVSPELIDRLMRECHNEAIEQCAKLADDYAQASMWANAPLATEASRQIAAAIRALKS